MKIKKSLFILLLGIATLIGPISAPFDDPATELALAPAKTAVAAGNDQAEDYPLALLEAQGEYAYAFDFNYSLDVVDSDYSGPCVYHTSDSQLWKPD